MSMRKRVCVVSIFFICSHNFLLLLNKLFISIFSLFPVTFGGVTVFDQAFIISISPDRVNMCLLSVSLYGEECGSMVSNYYGYLLAWIAQWNSALVMQGSQVRIPFPVTFSFVSLYLICVFHCIHSFLLSLLQIFKNSYTGIDNI